MNHKQSTDGMNQAGGHNAVGKTAKAVADTTSDVAKQRDMDSGQLPVSQNKKNS